ncbi:ATPase, T2SS/T4P/T4SS family [Polynucleobacter necessarius]|uniref:ATPase, T2SS/T4P/T4SS family n=1 Tax=Polynucleobacter necessarius TaxID=576610 RepID=UPI0018D509D5
MSQTQDDSLIVRTWFEIAVNALNSGASDIHIEARTQETLVRIRVDGELQIQTHYPIDLHERLITRIKILARLDIAEKRLPQDGRLYIGREFTRPNIDCRVSILPTLHGEKAVVRILPSQAEDLALDQIGLLPEPTTNLPRRTTTDQWPYSGYGPNRKRKNPYPVLLFKSVKSKPSQSLLHRRSH